MVLILLASLATAAVARASDMLSTDKALKFLVWLPSGFAAAPAHSVPLILFSHGYGGCAEQSRFLTEALSGAGYAVAAPNHADARCGGGARQMNAPAFRKFDNWTEASEWNRRADMEALTSYLISHQPYAAKIDTARMALMGHSLGGYTVLGMAGAWASWKDTRFKAVLALSPYAQPFVAHRSLRGIAVPVMYQGGSWDFAITPMIAKSGGAYDLTPSPKYFVEFRRAGHFAWTDLNTSHQEEIARYAIAFFDTVLRGKDAPLLRTPSRDLADFRAEN